MNVILWGMVLTIANNVTKSKGVYQYILQEGMETLPYKGVGYNNERTLVGNDLCVIPFCNKISKR